jgi:hypothetical protein
MLTGGIIALVAYAIGGANVLLIQYLNQREEIEDRKY